MWSPVEKTALAEAEVEYHDHTSHQIWVKFPVVAVKDRLFAFVESAGVDETVHSEIEKAHVVIWTTTPWTIPQNRAVAFNPEIAYGIYRVEQTLENAQAKSGDILILACELAASVFQQAKVSAFKQLAYVQAETLRGLTLAHPFRGLEGSAGEWDFDVPMLPGEHVTDDAGTGFVHTAPSHGDDDYQLGLKFGLPMTYNVLEDGSYRADLPLFGGQVIITPEGKEGPANVEVIKALAARGAFSRRASSSTPIRIRGGRRRR